jgi:hypothetical protein
MKDEPQSGCPAFVRMSTNFDCVGAFICQDQRLATPVIADELNTME